MKCKTRGKVLPVAPHLPFPFLKPAERNRVSFYGFFTIRRKETPYQQITGKFNLYNSFPNLICKFFVGNFGKFFQKPHGFICCSRAIEVSKTRAPKTVQCVFFISLLPSLSVRKAKLQVQEAECWGQATQRKELPRCLFCFSGSVFPNFPLKILSSDFP